VKTREVKDDVHSMFARVMRLRGMQVLRGRAFMPMLQGRCVGGSTFVNSAIAWRAPEDVWDDWASRFGLGGVVDARMLEPHYARLERDLSVRRVPPEVMGENNRLFVEQARARGIEAAPMARYDGGCTGSGMCLTGCPTAAKQSMSVTYVPAALRTGRARLFTSCRVERIEIRAGRAMSVVACAESGHRLELRARHAIVVAASTVQTPNLLRRSGVRGAALGRHFQAHPALAIGGRFDRRIRMSFGATQGAESIHFRQSDRFKLETIALPPDLATARIPGVGAELAERLARLDHVAMWAAVIRAEAEGKVGVGWDGTDRVRYGLTEGDLRAARKAAALIARLLFGAGAREVWPGIHGVPAVLTSIDQVSLLDEGPLDPRAYSFIASHLFGAARMGRGAGSSVVGPDFGVHGVDGLYVVDSSVFPTNLGVNPQHTIMALSSLASHRLLERIRRRDAA
jgi:choline dehydrogenase-like flavoprotein